VDHAHFGSGEFAALDLGRIAPVAAEEAVDDRVHQLRFEHDQSRAAQRLELDQVDIGRHVQRMQVFAELDRLDAAHRKIGRASKQIEQSDPPGADEALVDHLQRGQPAAHDAVLAGEIVGTRGAGSDGFFFGLDRAGVDAMQQRVDLVL
jgi:hypothetical protein